MGGLRDTKIEQNNSWPQNLMSHPIRPGCHQPGQALASP